MLKTALACREKSKLCPLSLVCACHQDSMSKCSELQARGSPLLTHFCIATPRIHAHCVLPLPWELTLRELWEMRRNLCLPDCNESLLWKVLPLCLYNYPKIKQNIKCISKKPKQIQPQIHRPCSPHCSGKITPLFLQHCECKELALSTSHQPSSVISGFLSFYSLSPCLLPLSFLQSTLSICSTQNRACDLLQMM